MARRRPTQLDLLATAGWGGARAGSGQKVRDHRNGPSHVPRPLHDPRHPVHVTFRARAAVPSLRSATTFRRLRRAIGASNRARFRIIHFSVQIDHLHLIVEADTHVDLRRGLQGLAIRCALTINRATLRRGRVWRHRYHGHVLRTPEEVRRAMTYVLLNFRKHLRAVPGVDPRSSGVWFEGWAEPREPSDWPRLVALPGTWLGASGWRRAGGSISVREQPRASRRSTARPRRA
jgi:REP-associated tyrosine transposase